MCISEGCRNLGGRCKKWCRGGCAGNGGRRGSPRFAMADTETIIHGGSSGYRHGRLSSMDSPLCGIGGCLCKGNAFVGKL